jgi:hypothetical protein
MGGFALWSSRAVCRWISICLVVQYISSLEIHVTDRKYTITGTSRFLVFL